MYNHERVTYGSEKNMDSSVEDPQERADDECARKKPCSTKFTCLLALPLCVFLIGLAISIAIHANNDDDDKSSDELDEDDASFAAKDNGWVPVYEPAGEGSGMDVTCGFEQDAYHRVGAMPCEALADFTLGQEEVPQCLTTEEEDVDLCKAQCCQLEGACFGVEYQASSGACRLFLRNKKETLVRYAFESEIDTSEDLTLAWTTEDSDSDLDASDLHLEELYREVNELRAALAKENEALRDLKKEYEDLETKMTTVVTERAAAVEALNLCKAESLQKSSELEKKMVACTTQLEAREDALCAETVRRESAQLQDRAAALQKQSAALQKQNQDLQTDLSKAKQELAMVRVQADKEIAVCKKSLQVCNGHLAQSEATVAKKTKEKAVLEQALAGAMKERDACQREVAETKRNYLVCSAEFKKQAKDKEAWVRKYWAVQGQLYKCSEEAEALKQQIEINGGTSATPAPSATPAATTTPAPSATPAPTVEYEETVLSA